MTRPPPPTWAYVLSYPVLLLAVVLGIAAAITGSEALTWAGLACVALGVPAVGVVAHLDSRARGRSFARSLLSGFGRALGELFSMP